MESVLNGDAQQCETGIALNGSNYKVVWELFKDRFGRKELIIFGLG